MLKRLLAAVMLLMPMAAMSHGQIVMKDAYEPFEKIAVGCDCVVPKNGDIKFSWRFHPAKGSRFEAMELEEGKKLLIWASPGQHELELTAVTNLYEEIDVLRPDPTNPGDLSKATWAKVRVAKSFDVERHDRTFVVKGSQPEPEPDPDNPDPPAPPGPAPDGLAGQARAWLKAVPASSYSKARASAIADNYLSVGSQGGDPARNGGWTLATFTAKTKELNLAVLGIEESANWAVPFFKPLAEAQAKLFAERNLTNGDVAEISKLWTETGEALKKAAF